MNFRLRDIIKLSIVAGAILLSGTISMTNGFAGDMPKFTEVDGLTVVMITDNYYDSSRPDSAVSKRFRATAEKSIHAEHGLSYYVEARSEGKTSAFMFDFGVDSHGVLRNMELLGVNLAKVEGLGLSHGHWDHWGAMLDILKANKEKIPQGTPLYVGQEAFAERFGIRPGSSVPTNLGSLNRGGIEAIGKLRIVEVIQPTEVMRGGYSTGSIERVTDYEKGAPNLLVKRGDKLEPDQFPGEQALFFILKGKGLVVLVGCAHPGIVNTVKYAQKITGVQKVHAILGGFHLTGAKSEKIQKTVAGIKAIGPDYIVPTHCTGYEAISLFDKEMPKQFILNTAGSKYTF